MKSKTTERIISIARPFAKTLILLCILSLVVNLAEIAKPYIVKLIIDDFISKNTLGEGFYTIYTVGVSYIFMVIIANVLDYLQKILSSVMGENIVYDIRNKLFKYVQRARISFHDKTPAGKLFVRITNDTEDILTLFKEVITTIVKETLLLVGIIVVMLILNVKLSLLSFLIIPLIILTTHFITKAIKKAYEYCKKLTTKINIFLSESIYGIRIIKIFNRQKEKEEECSKLTKEYWHARFLPTALEAVLPAIIDIIESLGVSIVIVSSVNGLWGIGLDVGLIYVFVTYIKKFFEPIISIVEKFETIQEAGVSIDRIYKILEDEENLEDLEAGINVNRIEGKIEFKNVWFSYNKKDWVLEDVSFTIEKGESIALVGKTGSRKNYNYKSY
jgi:ATP-binding cassette subfamily B protein